MPPIDCKGTPVSISASIQKVAHSTFDSDYIAAEIAERYPYKGKLEGRLLYRGFNDVYTLRDDDGRRALRVWRANARSLGQVMQELDFLEFLRGQGVPVSTPIPTLKNERHFILEAGEGQRPAVLYTWAPGRKFGDLLDVSMAEKIGAKFAEMHLVSKGYRPADAFVIDPAAMITDNLGVMLEWCEDRPEDIRDYTLLTERMPARIREMGAADLPRGMCHQDMHPANVHVTEDGGITFIDFDGCSEGYWLHDVQNFVFGSAFYGFDAKYGAAFERGYTKVRPYTADERDNVEMILLIKAFRLLGGAARATRSRGRDLLRLRTLDWFADYIKTRARKFGLL